MGWKKRQDTLELVRLKAEAVLYASDGVDAAIIARFVDRKRKTVQEWLRAWGRSRLESVVTGHAGNENAAKLTREQKATVATLLESPPSEHGIPAEFWDVPELKDVVATWFNVVYESDSSYHLLLRLAGMSFKLPDPFDKRRDEDAIATRMGEIRREVAGLLDEGAEVYCVDEVRVEHETETRRAWFPKGRRTKIDVDRSSEALSFFGALSLTAKRVKIYPIEGNQNADQMITMFARLQRETPGTGTIAVVLDNARFHHAKKLTMLFDKGNALDRIHPIYLPPYAPEHNPVEHVWNNAKGAIANYQRDKPENTFHDFRAYITNREFDYDFQHLPI